MARAAPSSTAADDSPTPLHPIFEKWWGKLFLIAASVLLLSFAYSPFKQFYLSWIGLVPWLMVIRSARGPWRAAFWSWVAGTAFFSANMWWLVFVTGPGLVALMAWLGLYWAGAGAVLWPVLRRLRPASEESPRRNILVLLAIPAVIVCFEWIRGSWPFSGLSWLYLAHAQTPFLPMCQIADITGELGVSFWVAMLNGLALLLVINRWRPRGLLVPAGMVAAVSGVILTYGLWRFGQEPSVLSPGPVVMVVQPNLPQDNSTGDKGAPQSDIISFHVVQTEKALREAGKRGQQIDLVVWSETLMPPLNPEVREIWPRVRPKYQRWLVGELEREAAKRGWGPREQQFRLDSALEASEDGLLLDTAHTEISRIAHHYNVGMLVGSGYMRSLDFRDGNFADSGRRNSAYLYQRQSAQVAGRFDKIHLVPFGEYIPFKEAWPWLYRQLIALGPPNMENYQLERGEQPVVFTLPKSSLAIGPTTAPAASQPVPHPPNAGLPTAGPPTAGQPAWRFVTPICFEDIDSDLGARMFRGGAARGDLPNGKAADLIINLTNDGWFRGTQQYQHLQCATFRCIENRAPMARSVNTGISGFIDSFGRTDASLLLPAGTPRAGTSDPATLSYQVKLDSRTTFFTQWGNLIGPACGIVIGAMVLKRLGQRFTRKRAV
jgi:apolipoprotein N-acyltransferase